MKKKNFSKMSIEEIKDYYETKGLILGAVFAVIIMGVALLGFFLGFKGF